MMMMNMMNVIRGRNAGVWVVSDRYGLSLYGHAMSVRIPFD